MTDLDKHSDRAEVLRAITASTPRVNYQYKDRFISAIRNKNYVEAWNAVFEAGHKDGKLEVDRQRFKEWRGTEEKRW